jgi:hypothetical protein
MRTAPPLRALAAALLLAHPPASLADTFGPAGGYVLHPAPPNPATEGRWRDPEGMGTREPAARSPMGRLYDMPLEAGEEEDAARRDAWRFWGFLEGGGTWQSGDERSALYRNYRDPRDGLLLNVFTLAGERPAAARYFEATGGAVGRDDAFYRLQAGRYNDWKVTAFFEGTPHTATTTYRSVWNGVGSGNLTLAGLAPGGTGNANTTQASILAALSNVETSELEVLRRKAGVRIDKKLGESWNAYASFTSERREGARPLGAVWGGGGGGGNVEIAEPIDYQTHDLAAGVRYAGAASSLNLSAMASLFRNGIDTLTFQNPLFITLNGSSGLSPYAFTQGRFDLPPDNEHYQAKAEYARAFPDLWRGTFTASAALGSMRQDDPLIAPTTLPLTGGTVTAGGASLANRWNTTDALSRNSADTRIDTRLVDLGLTVKPARALDVRGKLRYYETDNALQYLACNPLTGQFGRILNDGSGLSLLGASTVARQNPAGTPANAYDAARCDLEAARALGLVPATGNVPIAAVPNDYRQVNASLAADYRVARATSLGAHLEREEFKREHRERDKTREDRFRLAVDERGLLDGTLRLSYEHARRAGSPYQANPYEAFLGASAGPAPTANGVAAQSWFHSIGQFRSFDLADRKQDTWNGRVSYAFLPTLDGAATLQAKDADFDASHGRSGRQKSRSFTLDLTWQAGAAGEVYGFYSYQGAEGHQRGVTPNSCVLGSTYYFYSDGQVLTAATGGAAPATPPGTTLVASRGVTAGNWQALCGEASATSPLFPDSRGWSMTSRDRGDVLGLGARYDLGRARLDASFTRTLGRTRIGYTYNAAGLGLTPMQAALAGDGFSDMTFAQNVASVSVVVPVNKMLSIRLLLRHESGRVRDWHYEGLAETPMPTNNSLYLDAGPQDYRVNLVGLLFQVRL